MTNAATALGAHEIRQIAVEACADDRTVRRYLADPKSVQSTSRARIAAALARLGFQNAATHAEEVGRGRK